MEQNLLRFFPETIKFSDRPQALPANQRIIWKVALILYLIGATSKACSTSLKRLNLFVSVLQHPGNEGVLHEIIRNRNRLVLVSVRFDPSLPRILSYMNAWGLIVLEKEKYKLSDSAKKISKALQKADEVFKYEKSIISSFAGSELTETFLSALFKNG